MEGGTMTGKADFAATQGKSVEAYTPREWWQRCIDVMGKIDCDPASDPEMHIPAGVHYTKNENGLRQEWNGKTYLNPPFGRGIKDWFEKARVEMDAGRCIELIICWKAALETEATQTIINAQQYQLSAVPTSRISFHAGNVIGGEFPKKRGGGASATFTPIFHYLGNNPVLFAQVFGQVCTLWKPRPIVTLTKTFWGPL
jgi:hypothetical protein